jgi:MFS family permease
MSLESPLHRKKERWITLVFFFLSGIITATWSSRIPDVQQRLGLNNAAWGTVLFIVPVGLIAGLSVSSWLVARYGTRLMMVASVIGFALMLCLAGVANTRLQLMAVLFGMGTLRTILNISINTQSVLVQKRYERPIVSTFHGVWSGACFLAAGIGTLMIIGEVAPAVHFVAITLLASVAALFFWKAARSGSGAPAEKRPFFVRPDRYLFLLGLTAFCGLLCESAMFDWGVNYFEKAVRPGKEWVTAGYTAFIVAMAFGRLVGDRVIAAFGYFTLLLVNGALMAAGFLLAAFFPYLLPAAFGFLIIGLGDSVIVPIVYSLSAHTTRMSPGYALASVALIGNAGFLLGPLLIGYLSEIFSMQWAFGMVSLFSLSISFLALKVRQEKKALDLRAEKSLRQ